MATLNEILRFLEKAACALNVQLRSDVYRFSRCEIFQAMKSREEPGCIGNLKSFMDQADIPTEKIVHK